MLLFFSLSNLHAQDGGLEISISQDTILAGNKFELSYTIKNVDATIKDIPALDSFKLISGPNQSSSMSFINGEMSKEISLSFILIADEEGVFEIPQPELLSEDENLTFEKRYLVVLPNPDNIQEPLLRDEKNKGLTPKKKKTKRKLYRI